MIGKGEWGMGKLGERVGLSGDKGLVNWGVFGKWMGMGWVWGWGESDDWFVGNI